MEERAGVSLPLAFRGLNFHVKRQVCGGCCSDWTWPLFGVEVTCAQGWQAGLISSRDVTAWDPIRLGRLKGEQMRRQHESQPHCHLRTFSSPQLGVQGPRLSPCLSCQPGVLLLVLPPALTHVHHSANVPGTPGRLCCHRAFCCHCPSLMSKPQP